MPSKKDYTPSIWEYISTHGGVALKASQFLIWLGIVVLIVEVVANLYNVIHLNAVHATGMNIGSTITVLFSSLFQGGLLIGVGKILEAIQSKK